MLFQCDEQLEMLLFRGEYCSSLSSEDIFDPELPLIRRSAKGGTMILWKTELDQYVSVQTSPSSSFLAIVFSPPGHPPTIHLSVYLPTAGKDDEYTEEVLKIAQFVTELGGKYPEASIYIRGDLNANPKDKNRGIIVKKLCDDLDLAETTVEHPTYHHFLGDGRSDSQLDVLLHSKNSSETLLKILCKLENPLVTSHHDALLSSFLLPPQLLPRTPPSNPLAPRLVNNRVKIHWTDAGVFDYKNCVSENLSKLRSTWLDASSRGSFSVLLQSTNAFMDICAKKTNSFTSLANKPKTKSVKKPRYVELSERRLLRSHKLMKTKVGDPVYAQLSRSHKYLRRNHHQLLRYSNMQQGITRDRILNKICTQNPSSAYKSIKTMSKPRTSKISKLRVGIRTYLGDTVPDGMFESIRSLKTEPPQQEYEPEHPDFSEEYRHILDICKAGRKIPPLSKEKSLEILKSIRKNVNDFCSITALHYINAGQAGYDHFHFILNTVISNVNLAGITELNTIYACVLYKGHGKEKTSDRSYRTISTCPLLAKGLDIYVRDLSLDAWNDQQAPTQFQGEGMSHELAALLLTETIQHSLNVTKLPVFALFLDAKSAFDRVLKEILVRNMYNAGTDDQRLLYLDQRLANRQTYVDFDQQLMGPIHDERGLEQGGVASSDKYKLYNNEQAKTAQQSGLGVSVLGFNISCITLADDGVLLSNSIHYLKNLLFLTEQYCGKYKVELVPDKTKLLAFCNNEHDVLVKYSKAISPISLNGQKIEFSEQAEHLGILRTAAPGNVVNILDRMSAYRSKLFSVLPAGMALHHHADPAACLRVHQLYALPVLLSGLSALALSKSETVMIDSCFKNTLNLLMKLHDRTPDCAVFFLAGSLPGSALLHLRQLSVFSMICNLRDNVLKSLVKDILIGAKTSAKSWIQDIRDLTIQYQLPHPLFLLENPIPKDKFKQMCKQKVQEYWHAKLSLGAALPSLQYLQPSFLSLCHPHPIFTSLDGNPYQARASRIQALFLTGRYRSERLCRFWSTNKNGVCLLEPCRSQELFEDIDHIILKCSGLTDVRRRLALFTSEYTADKPVLREIVETYLCADNDELRMQFIIDCSVLPLVISSYQHHGPIIHQQLFKITRTWCRSLHVARMKALGRFNKL